VAIRPGIHTTGEVGRGVAEQALAVVTTNGLVVVTGSAHPGFAKMVCQAKELVSGEMAAGCPS